MSDKELATFRRKIIGERVLLMLPLNAVFAGRVRETVNPPEVAMNHLEAAVKQSA